MQKSHVESSSSPRNQHNCPADRRAARSFPRSAPRSYCEVNKFQHIIDFYNSRGPTKEEGLAGVDLYLLHASKNRRARRRAASAQITDRPFSPAVPYPSLGNRARHRNAYSIQ